MSLSSNQTFFRFAERTSPKRVQQPYRPVTLTTTERATYPPTIPQLQSSTQVARRAYLQQRRRPQAPFTRTQRLESGGGIIVDVPKNTFRPVIDYDYYDDGDVKVIGKSNTKVINQHYTQFSFF